MISAIKYLPLTKAFSLIKGASFKKTIPLTGVVSFEGTVTANAAMKLYVADTTPDLTYSATVETDSNGSFIVLSATQAQTATLDAGYYFFDLSMTDGTDTVVICTGMVHVNDGISTNA